MSNTTEATLASATDSSQNTKGRLTNYASALREALDHALSDDERVFVMGLDVDDHIGIQGSTQDLHLKYGPNRVFSTPLSEDAMTGVAIGAAMAGMRPIHVHIRMDFLMLCMNQLVNMAAKAADMYHNQVQVPLVVRAMIGRSWGQGAQHSQALHSLFMHIPGLKVVAPSNAHDAKGCLLAAIADDSPVIFVEHRLLYRVESYVSPSAYITPLGKARVVSQGDDITIVAISHMVMEAMRAKQVLEQTGISVEIIDPISLYPLDMQTIATSIKKTKRLLVVDNAWMTCGASSEILARVVELFPDGIQGKHIMMQRMGFAETTCPTTHTLENHFYPNGSTIAQQVYKMVTRKADWEPPALEIGAEIGGFKGPF